ncbi:MAG: hypothetical protein L6Q97_15205, partial [Thermoanaerobaculia bacterium]|nr:hypothetical protein [Thermoanaerobaculia bacterium]
MSKHFFNSFSILFCLAGSALHAQNFVITFQTPDQLVVCGADTLRITIQNKTAAPISGALLDIEMPQGLEYLPGSATGASESNIANPEKPELALPALQPNVPVTIRVQLYAGCGLTAAINSGQLFSLLLRVRNGAQIEQLNTSAFQIQTSLLVITKVDNDSISGVKDQVLTRTLHVQNSRLGPVKHLFLRDGHPAGISIHTPGAIAEQDDPTLYTARFDGAFFTAFGDGDTLLEFGETALLQQQIRILDCGVPLYTCRSNISAEWSCAPAQAPCQGDSTYADVVILPSALQPKLVFKPQYGLPWDICGDIPAEMKVRVVNEGPGLATNIILQIRSELPDLLALDKNSFRLHRQQTTQPLPYNLSEDVLMSACGDTQSARVTIAIPELAGFDSMDVIFNTFYCADACQQELPELRLNYFYNKPCPAGSFLAADTLRIKPDLKARLTAGVSYSFGDCLKDGETYVYSYFMQSSRLLSDSGYLWLTLHLPRGVEWSPDCPPLAGDKAPVAFSIDPVFIGYPAKRVSMAFELPLSAASAKMDFCLKNTCPDDAAYVAIGPDVPDAAGNFFIFKPTNPPCTNCGYDIKTAALLTLTLDQPLECGIPACDSFRLRTLCPCPDSLDPVDPDTSGKCRVLREYQTAQRLNYGLPDNDDNRIADPTGALDMNKVRRDRFWPGDTLRNVLSTKVVCGGSIDSLFYRLYLEVIGSDFGYGGNYDTFNIGPNQLDAARLVFTEKDFIRVARTSFAIWDSSANTVYTCTLKPDEGHENLYGQVALVNTRPVFYFDELTTMNFPFQPNMAELAQTGCLPSGFMLETGDSVVLTVDLRLAVNYTPLSKQHYPPLINFEMGYARGGTFYNYRQNDTLMFQYTGFIDSLTGNTFGIRPCTKSVQVTPLAYNTRIARDNLFPYEVRPMAKISDNYLYMPPGVTPVSAEMLFLHLQNNQQLWQNAPIPFWIELDTILRLDFTHFYDSPPDEGYALRTNVSFAPSCSFTEPDSSALRVELEFPDSMQIPDPEIQILENKIGFYANHPRDTMTTDEQVIDFPTPAVLADVLVQNQAPVAAPNYWVRLVNPEGGLTGLGVTILPGTVVTPLNGIFQVGVLPIFGQKNLRISGVNTTCDPQRLLVIYGWDCQPYTQPGASSCGIDTLELFFRPQNPELELQLLQMPAEAPLCENSEYVVFEISNADLGHAYKPFATLELPPGFQLTPGSCQIAYPANSAFVNIPDPVATGMNTYEWNLAALHNLINLQGLAGVDIPPQNALRIRFKVFAECGVVSNMQLVFGARAEWSCGKPTNVLRKASDPLPVEGVMPDYEVQISVNETGSGGPAVCGAQRRLSVNLLLSGPALPGDSIYVALPPGFTYLAGSYQPGINAPAGPPQIAGANLRWPMPAGLPANTVVSFDFTVLSGNGPNCSDAPVRVLTRQQTAAFCPVIDNYCTVYAATGEASYIFPAADPDPAIISVDIGTDANGLTDLTVVVGNNSAFDLPGLVLQLYHDLDGDGLLTGNDTLMRSLATPATFPAGSTLSFSLTGLKGCQLLLVLPAAENCDCENVVYPVSNERVISSTQSICTGQRIDMGVPAESGHSYWWSGGTGIPCDTCSLFVFEPFTSGQYQFVLLDEGAGCSTERRFMVMVNNPPALLTADTAVCAGQPLSLQTSPAVSWAWTGPGNLSSSNPVLTITPLQTGTYHVVATNA